jgi:hypothetical protein
MEDSTMAYLIFIVGFGVLIAVFGTDFYWRRQADRELRQRMLAPIHLPPGVKVPEGFKMPSGAQLIEHTE